ncbi:MAG: hypothetical protein ACI39H_01565 [Lachnospiraceae bacterium]
MFISILLFLSNVCMLFLVSYVSAVFGENKKILQYLLKALAKENNLSYEMLLREIDAKFSLAELGIK